MPPLQLKMEMKQGQKVLGAESSPTGVLHIVTSPCAWEKQISYASGSQNSTAALKGTVATGTRDSVFLIPEHEACITFRSAFPASAVPSPL